MRAHTLSKARLLVAVATVLVAGLVTAAVHPTVSALNTCETNKNCPQKLNLTKVFSPHDPVATVDFKVTNNNNGYEQTPPAYMTVVRPVSGWALLSTLSLKAVPV